MGGFIFKRLEELGLPRPQVDHVAVARAGFEAVAAG